MVIMKDSSINTLRWMRSIFERIWHTPQQWSTLRYKCIFVVIGPTEKNKWDLHEKYIFRMPDIPLRITRWLMVYDMKYELNNLRTLPLWFINTISHGYFWWQQLKWRKYWDSKCARSGSNLCSMSLRSSP